jgi:Putative peptidoglycan binding domain/Trypsin
MDTRRTRQSTRGGAGAALALAAALAFAHPTPVHAAIFERDERVALPDAMGGLTDRIGLIVDERSRTVCTAFCVGEAMVATAAHCVFHRTADTGPVKPADIWFTTKGMSSPDRTRVFGADLGQGLGNIMAGTTKLRLKPPIDATDDWAVLKLAKPACARGVLPVRGLPPDRLLGEAAAGRIYQAAFHADVPGWKLSIDRACEIRSEYDGLDAALIRREFSAPANLVLHRCDTGIGSSGSPLLLDMPGGPYVVGINVGTYLQSKLLLRGGRVVRNFAPSTIANTGVGAAEFATRLEAFRDAELLADPEEVRALQVRMAALGHYKGAVDGILGEQTRIAVRILQRSFGQVDTGVPTADLFRRMELPVAGTIPAVSGHHVPTSGSP